MDAIEHAATALAIEMTTAEATGADTVQRSWQLSTAARVLAAAATATDQPGAEILRARWRVGRHLGRTLYAVVGDAASDRDVVIGMVDSRDVAALIVREHNAALDLS